jgi:hypothetical protein
MVAWTLSPERRGSVSPPAPAAYVYNGRPYTLAMRSLRARPRYSSGGRDYGAALDASFEIRNESTKNTTKFSLVYGRSGELAGVPLEIVFRPKWWFEAELVLAGS